MDFQLGIDRSTAVFGNFFLEDDVVFAKLFHSIVAFRASSVPPHE